MLAASAPNGYNSPAVASILHPLTPPRSHPFDSQDFVSPWSRGRPFSGWKKKAFFVRSVPGLQAKEKKMIRVENVTKYYREVCAVDQINLEIRKGEILGFLGPNGAGKTTTMRMLCGFIRPTSGGIQVKGYDMEKNALEIKKLLGYLPESAPLYHDMLAYDYLTFIAAIRELEGERGISRIRELADLCGLNEVMHKPIGELSKGYKQRVGLAHAMMSDPEILILDEPTSGLDPNQIVEIREIIKKAGQEKTVILSTHILSEAEATCDRIVIINQGKIVADDLTKNLKQSENGRCLIQMTLKNTDFQGAAAALGSVEGVETVSPTGEAENVVHLKLACRSSDDLREEIYRRIKGTDWVLLEFRQETRTLEHIFRELTKEN
jgi:ABC-2 type transport system ATP-binding protein